MKQIKITVVNDNLEEVDVADFIQNDNDKRGAFLLSELELEADAIVQFYNVNKK
jgi:hypothetical protein